MSARSAEADSRENTPDHEASPGGKRASKKRKVLSCYACRDRKMKCDRVIPVCGRCEKTGRADQCTYDPRLLEDSTGNNGVQANKHHAAATLPQRAQDQQDLGLSSLEAIRFRARTQERRIEELERRLATEEEINDNNYSAYKRAKVDEPAFEEQMMFRGKGFKTQFHGSTSVMSTIAQYRELQAFTREALTVDHSIMRVKTDFKQFRDRRKMATNQRGARILGTDDEIFTAIPDRSAVDTQIALYFQTWETAYRILHEPSFWKEYNAFWEQKVAGESSSGFAVMLLLMVASTKCLTVKDDVFEGDTTADRQAAANIIDLCETWIGRQPRKRLTLQFFQLRILLLFAKRVNCVGAKQDWVASGDLVRLALASGMHRDPALLLTGKISPFEKEMKKRLWVTIVELELQSSLESGLQSSLAALYWDTPAPLNLPDDAFSADTHELPASRPLEHFTSSSYLSVSRGSMPFRLHLMQLLNDPSQRLNYEEVLQYDTVIHTWLSAIPKWTEARAALPTTLLELQLRQFLLILHNPYASLAPTNDKYIYSLTACVNVAGNIISTHTDLVTTGILALNHMRNDVVRVALTLSRLVYYNCLKDSPVVTPAPPPPNLETHFADPASHFADLPSAKATAPGIVVSLAHIPPGPSVTQILLTVAIEVLELASKIFEQKVMRMGTGYMEYWLLCAAIGMLPASETRPTQSSITQVASAMNTIEGRCRRTLDRFQTLAFRVLALQKDPRNSFASSLRTTMATVSPSDVRTPNSGGVGVVTENSGFGDVSAVGNGAYAGMAGGMGSNFGASTGSAPKEMDGVFDNLEDMQIDLGEWNFPDFWAFDLGGDF